VILGFVEHFSLFGLFFEACAIYESFVQYFIIDINSKIDTNDFIIDV
jgi:5-methylcytosine-specific restriction endonuclease McrBC regulatory subunit McrC